ncbi:MAG TPA: type II toxin-antitoxin system HicA family toxin [Dongiaceae bacterium]|nr:type II toxin-antitoxin system HicA family toxin [Dongiaceae bacterium]
MPRLPRISGAEAIRALEQLGFEQVRQRGSHVVLKRLGESKVTGCVVPLHNELASGTLRGILKQAGVGIEDFISKL